MKLKTGDKLKFTKPWRCASIHTLSYKNKIFTVSLSNKGIYGEKYEVLTPEGENWGIFTLASLLNYWTPLYKVNQQLLFDFMNDGKE